MCVVRRLDYDEELNISVMPYADRDTKEKKLEILDKLRCYMNFIAETDSTLARGKFNFFCFGNFLSGDKDIDTVDCYIYADRCHISLISTYIRLYMANVGLRVAIYECDGVIDDIDVKAAESMSWLYDDDISDEFKELLKKLNADHTNSRLNRLLSGN